MFDHEFDAKFLTQKANGNRKLQQLHGFLFVFKILLHEFFTAISLFHRQVLKLGKQLARWCNGHKSGSHAFQIPEYLLLPFFLSQITAKFNVKNPTRNQLMFQHLFRKTTRIKNFSNCFQLLMTQSHDFRNLSAPFCTFWPEVKFTADFGIRLPHNLRNFCIFSTMSS